MNTNVELRPRNEAEIDSGFRDASFLERLAEKVGVNARAATIFGEPVRTESITIIPVAKARWGFGGGGGSGAGDTGAAGGGSGGGGGMIVTPAGYIEIRDGSSRFRAIHSPVEFLPLVAVCAAALLLIVRSIRYLR